MTGNIEIRGSRCGSFEFSSGDIPCERAGAGGANRGVLNCACQREVGGAGQVGNEGFEREIAELHLARARCIELEAIWCAEDRDFARSRALNGEGMSADVLEFELTYSGSVNRRDLCRSTRDPQPSLQRHRAFQVHIKSVVFDFCLDERENV